MPTTNPLILGPAAGTADARGNPPITPYAGPLGGQNIGGVMVDPAEPATQTDALAAISAQHLARQQVIADALEAERQRLLRPKFDNVIGGVQSTEAAAAAPAAPYTGPEATKMQMVGDALLGVASGIPALVELVGTLGGLATGNVDNALTQFGRSAREGLQSAQSDELKADRAARDARVAAAEGEVAKAAAYVGSSVGDINLFIDAIASNIATGGPAGFAGRMAARGVAKSLAKRTAQKVAARAPAANLAAKKAAEKIAQRVGMTTAIGVGAVQQGMDVAGDVYFDTLADDDWDQNPDYVARVGAGEDPDDVKHDMALDAARAAAPAAIALSAASQLAPGGRAIEKMFVGRTARDALRKSGFWSRVGATAKGALGEATQEVIEEGGGAAVGNLAQDALASPTALGEGVGAAAGAGAVGGLGLGGIAGLTTPDQKPRTAPTNPLANPNTPRPGTTPSTPNPNAPAAGATPAAPGAAAPAAAGAAATTGEAATGEAASAAPAPPEVVPRGVAALPVAERGRAAQRAANVVIAANKALAKAGVKEYDENGRLTDRDMQISVEDFLADPEGTAEDLQAAGIEGKALQDLNAMALDLRNRTAPAEAEAEMRYALTPDTVERIKRMNDRQLEAWAAAAGGTTTDPDGNESPRWSATDMLRMIARGEVRPSNAVPADVEAQLNAGFEAVPVELPEIGPVTAAQSVAQAQAAAVSMPRLPDVPNPAERRVGGPALDPLVAERDANRQVQAMKAQQRRAAAANNPLTRGPARTSSYGELRDDAQLALDAVTANPTPENTDRAIAAARAAAEAAPAAQAKKFWTDMANDLAADAIGARFTPSTPVKAAPTNPLQGGRPRPKAEAAPAAAGGRQTAPAATAPARATPPANESPAERRMRERRERAQSPTIPRAQDTTSAKADAVEIEQRDAAIDQLFSYEGTRTLPGRAPEVALATPTGNGTEYRVNIPGQPVFFVSDAQAARTALKAANFTHTERSISRFADLPGEMVRPTLEQKASAPVRAAARLLYVGAQPFGVERARKLRDGFLEAMASTASALMSRYTFVDQMEAGLKASTGEETRLGRAFRNALQRARSVGTRIGSPAFKLRRQIAGFLRDVNSNETEFGQFVYALDAIERNERYAGKKIAGTDLRIDANPAAFEWTDARGRKRTGTEGAREYLASLPADKRKAFDAAYAVTRQMVQDALSLQWQLGVISEDTYFALGGKYADGSQREGARRYWAPLLTEGQEGFSTMETPEGRYTQAANPYVNLLRETTRMQRAALMNQPWQEMYAWLLKHPDPSFATLNAQEAKPKGDELVWQRSDIANERSVWVFFNGERRSITFNDKQAQRFIAHSRDTERHAFLNAMRAGIQWMAAFRTAWNVAFVLPATAWDALMLGSSVQSAAAGTLDKEAASDVTQRAFKHLLSAMSSIGTTAVTREVRDHYYEVYAANGGGIAFGDRQGYGDVADRVRGEIGAGNALQQGWSKLKETGSKYSDLLHAPEAAFRFAVFKAYIEHKAGRSFESADALRAWGTQHRNEFEQALEMSRLITADFSDAGLSSGPRSLYMFFNAAMQGTRSLARLPQSERGRQALTIMLMAGAAAALIGAGGEDDEDVDGGSRYARLKGRGRQIQFGEGFAIPLAPEMRMAYTLGNSMALWAMGKIGAGEAAADFGRSAVDTVSPLRIPESDMPSDSLLYTFAPSISHPFLVAILGMDGFGRDTETEEDRTFTYDKTGKRVKIENPANYERGRDRDPEWAKNTARWAYDTIGVDLFPGRIAEVMRTVFGGVYSFIDKTESDGIGEATFRGFQTEYDEFAVRHEYEQTVADAAQELRRLQTNVNPLTAPAADRERIAALKKLQGAEKSLRNVRVNGYDENAVYALLRRAEASGDENQIAEAERLMDLLRAEKARIMGEAAAAVRGAGVE